MFFAIFHIDETRISPQPEPCHKGQMVAVPLAVSPRTVGEQGLHAAVLVVIFEHERGVVNPARLQFIHHCGAYHYLVEAFPTTFIFISALGSVAACSFGGYVGHVFRAYLHDCRTVSVVVEVARNDYFRLLAN